MDFRRPVESSSNRLQLLTIPLGKEVEVLAEVLNHVWVFRIRIARALAGEVALAVTYVTGIHLARASWRVLLRKLGTLE